MSRRDPRDLRAERALLEADPDALDLFHRVGSISEAANQVEAFINGFPGTVLPALGNSHRLVRDLATKTFGVVRASRLLGHYLPLLLTNGNAVVRAEGAHIIGAILAAERGRALLYWPALMVMNFDADARVAERAAQALSRTGVSDEDLGLADLFPHELPERRCEPHLVPLAECPAQEAARQATIALYLACFERTESLQDVLQAYNLVSTGRAAEGELPKYVVRRAAEIALGWPATLPPSTARARD